jgi:excisionase family DNA binding protein
MSHQSYSVSEAARLLGVSTPTARRMAAEGELNAFRTPGGHLRITHESLEAIRKGPKEKRETQGPSPVLRNRRERVEELALEAQELRAQREIERLRREKVEEREQAEAEAEAQERQAEREGEAARLRLERVRIQQARQRQRHEAEQLIRAFHSRWLGKAIELIPDWLCQDERREALAVVETEIKGRQPEDERMMPRLVAGALAAAIGPHQSRRDSARKRKEAKDSALRVLLFATDSERAQASRAAADAVHTLPDGATEDELRAAASAAVAPIYHAIDRRRLFESVLEKAVREIPIFNRTEQNECKLRRECQKILNGLPADVSEAKTREAIRETVEHFCTELEERENTKEKQRQERWRDERRKQRIAQLVASGLAEVDSYLIELRRADEISAEAYWDSEWKADLKEIVREALERVLAGDESADDIQGLVREVVEDELEAE